MVLLPLRIAKISNKSGLPNKPRFIYTYIPTYYQCKQLHAQSAAWCSGAESVNTTVLLDYI